MTTTSPPTATEPSAAARQSATVLWDNFRARTGPLVDALVSAHRRLVALLRESTDNPTVTFSCVDLVQFALRLGRAVSDSEIALAALDEAARG